MINRPFHLQIGNNERVPSVLKRVLEKFGQDPSTYERYCIEQRVPGQRTCLLMSKTLRFNDVYRSFSDIVLTDQSTVFYALIRPSTDEEIELVIREKTRTRPKSTFQRTLSGFSRLSTHSH